MRKAEIFAGLALIMVACTSELKESTSSKYLYDKVFASVSNELDTRTNIDLSRGQKIQWCKGDEISLFASFENERYVFDDVIEGKGIFSHVSGTTGMMTFSNVYAFYPYSSSNSISDDGISMTFPSVQEYSENGFASGSAPMIAISPRADNISLQFLPLCGYLRLNLWNSEGKKVRKIEFTAGGNVKIAGPAHVFYNGISDPTVLLAQDATSTITLDCGENGVALGKNSASATEFWICIPPVQLSSGYSITVTDTEQFMFSLYAGASRTVTNNTYYSAPAAEISDSSLYVDLGLSVKWATCNLGASKPEEYGDYYAWGETETKSYYSTSNYKFYKSETVLDGEEVDMEYKGYTKYVPQETADEFGFKGFYDDKTVLDPEDDVAHVKLGGKWRMPTDEEWLELRNNCQSEWVTYKGVKGRKFTSKKEGYTDKWIFLPAAGIWQYDGLSIVGSGGVYWSLSLSVDSPSWAHYVYIFSNGVHKSISRRFNGQSIRPVCEK